MITNSNTSLSNFFILATLSTSVVNINYETVNYLIPQKQAVYEHDVDIADWKDNAFSRSFDYSFYNQDFQKISTMISFTKNLLESSKDIESEFVDIVNNNFWDLI